MKINNYNLRLGLLFFVGFWALKANCLYNLAVCAIFQNEARFMKEWLEFHKLVGVQHFYLYNNFSNDNFLEILKPYIQNGEVDLLNCNIETGTTTRAQISAYNNALSKVKGKVKWLAFLDLDEFLFPVKKNNLLDLLKDYEDYGAVSVNWFMFGTSNIKKIPKDGLLIEYLTWCDPKGTTVVKSIVRPERVKVMYPHFANEYEPGYVQVNPDKAIFRGAFSPYVSRDKLRINHYWTRDIHYFESIKIPRVNSLKSNLMAHQGGWYLDWNEAKNLSSTEWAYKMNEFMNQGLGNNIILKYIKSLKYQMKRNI